jgi:exodeoxyribonuclease VII large subunit
VRLLLSAAVVQGDGAVKSLISALDLLEQAQPDVIIIGRGGGSADDLMAFNDERVVRRVAACAVPIVSAVGHEIDISLTDLVADARAATPSQAAEMVVPDALERRATLRRLKGHLSRTIFAYLAESRVAHDRCRRKLTDPRFLLAEHQQGLDELSSRLNSQMRARLETRGGRLQLVLRRLYVRHPRAVLAAARADLAPLRERLLHGMPRRLDGQLAELRRQSGALSALSPLSVLGRGYSIVAASNGRAIRDVDEVLEGQELTIKVRRGSFSAAVGKVLSTVENQTGIDHESPAADAAREEEP